MHVIPKKGSKIPDPELGDFLPETGREVNESSYWLRRLRDGDVTKKDAPKPKPAPAPKKEDK